MDVKGDIIQSAEREYAKLRAAVHGLDDAQMTEAWLGRGACAKSWPTSPAGTRR
jgi:hypothetical protein